MQNDFILREIEMLARFVGNSVFHRQESLGEIIDENGTLSGELFLEYALRQMIDEGKINEAENLLFHKLEQEPCPQYWQAAVAFYAKLAALTDEELERRDFSREEIAMGLTDIRRQFGLGNDEETGNSVQVTEETQNNGHESDN